MNTNCQDETFFDSSQFLIIASHCGCSLSIPINLFGLYLIYFKTPRGMRTLQWTIFNVHIWGLVSDFCLGTLIIPFVFLPLVMGFPAGVLSIFGVPVILQVCLGCACIGGVASAVTLLFENRQNNMVHSWFKIEQPINRFIFHGVNLLMPILAVIPTITSNPDQKISKELGEKQVPCLTQEFHRDEVVVIVVDTSLVSLPLALLTIFYMFQIVVFSLHCVYHLFKVSNVSTRTRHLQRRFFFSVCVQFFVPMTALCFPMSYIIYSLRWKIYNQAFNNLCFIIISMYGCFSMIPTIFIFEPYRLFTMRTILRINVNKGSRMFSGINNSIAIL